MEHPVTVITNHWNCEKKKRLSFDYFFKPHLSPRTNNSVILWVVSQLHSKQSHNFGNIITKFQSQFYGWSAWPVKSVSRVKPKHSLTALQSHMRCRELGHRRIISFNWRWRTKTKYLFILISSSSCLFSYLIKQFDLLTSHSQQIQAKFYLWLKRWKRHRSGSSEFYLVRTPCPSISWMVFTE